MSPCIMKYCQENQIRHVRRILFKSTLNRRASQRVINCRRFQWAHHNKQHTNCDLNWPRNVELALIAWEYLHVAAHMLIRNANKQHARKKNNNKSLSQSLRKPWLRHTKLRIISNNKQHLIPHRNPIGKTTPQPAAKSEWSASFGFKKEVRTFDLQPIGSNALPSSSRRWTAMERVCISPFKIHR